MHVRPLETVDLSSRLVLGGVGILMIAGVAATILTSLSGPATDLSTPLGVVTSYVQAVEAGDADRAWALTGQTTVQPAISNPPRPFLSRDDYRQQVQNSRQATRPRIRILSSSQSGATATVELEVSHSSGDPLTGTTMEQVTLSLTRQTGSWRITSDPFPGQVE